MLNSTFITPLLLPFLTCSPIPPYLPSHIPALNPISSIILHQFTYSMVCIVLYGPCFSFFSYFYIISQLYPSPCSTPLSLLNVVTTSKYLLQGHFIGEGLFIRGEAKDVYGAALVANGPVVLSQVNLAFVRRMLDMDKVREGGESDRRRVGGD